MYQDILCGPTLSLKVPPLFLISPPFLGYGPPTVAMFGCKYCKTSSSFFDYFLQADAPSGPLTPHKFWEKSFVDFRKYGPRNMAGVPKSAKKFFDADFGAFAGILRIWSKLQKFIILEALRDSFEILEKSLTVFEILEKGHFAP